MAANVSLSFEDDALADGNDSSTFIYNTMVPQDVVYRNAIITMLVVFSIVGTICNGISLLVISHESHVKTSTVLIASLAVTDLFTCAVSIPANIYMIFAKFIITYEVFCHIYVVFTLTSVPYSCTIVTGIAIDRLCYAIWPYCHVTQVKLVKVFVSLAAATMLVFAIVSSFCYSVYDVVGGTADYGSDYTSGGDPDNGDYGDMYYTTTTGNDYELTTVYTGQCRTSSFYFSFEQVALFSHLNTAIFLLCMTITCLAYSCVFVWAIRRRLQQQFVKDQRSRYLAKKSLVPKNDRGRSDSVVVKHKEAVMAAMTHQARVQSKTLKLYFKTLLTVFLVTVVFVLAITPALLVKYGLLGAVEPDVLHLLYYLHYINSWANPFIYYTVNETFRANVGVILRRKAQLFRIRFLSFKNHREITKRRRRLAMHRNALVTGNKRLGGQSCIGEYSNNAAGYKNKAHFDDGALEIEACKIEQETTQSSSNHDAATSQLPIPESNILLASQTPETGVGSAETEGEENGKVAEEEEETVTFF